MRTLRRARCVGQQAALPRRAVLRPLPLRPAVPQRQLSTAAPAHSSGITHALDDTPWTPVNPPAPADTTAALRRAIDSGMSADDALELVHPAAMGEDGPEHWSYNLLVGVLSLQPSAHSLAALLPLVADAENRAARGATAHMRLMAKYINAVSRAGALVFLIPVVEAAFHRIEEQLAADLNTETATKAAENTISHHHTILHALGAYAGNDPYYRNARDLPQHVQYLVGVVVKHLIVSLESVPSSSAARPSIALRQATLDAVFSPQLLVPGSLAPLIEHCKSTGVEMKPAYWRQAATVAAHSGDSAAAAEYAARVGDEGEGHENADVLLAALVKSSVNETIEALVPLLSGGRSGATNPASGATHAASGTADTSDIERAWCYLLSRASSDPTVSPQAIIDLANGVPEAAISAYTLTPAMHALNQRGDADTAMRIWTDLVRRYRVADPARRRHLIDATALSVGAEVAYSSALGHTDDALERPIKLVDQYARSPTPVPLDTQTLNTLLRMCLRSGRPGTAFRLWHAAPLRWGLSPDDISLTLLLNTARFNNHDTELDAFRHRLRLLRDALGAQHTDAEIAQEPLTRRAAEWPSAPASVLLDGARYSWREEHGAVQPWEKARALFRDVVLGNWPALADVRSPLEHPSGAWSAVSGFISPPSALAAHAPRPPPAPSGLATYPHIIPSEATWNAYVGLLGSYDRPREIPTALAWMRELRAKPLHRTMATALMHIGEHEGPRRRVRWASGETALARDEEIMRAWLVEWLGAEAVPTEEEVAEHRRARTSKPLSR
ncbi:hypothetical protein Q8F55_000888 [Vanrija albida]|uniref:ATPase expression protein 2, mitochondrial n=1 Tax=Vanrija albida TaxID=181172 RepID=A0ABR3QEL2_9TREE